MLVKTPEYINITDSSILSVEYSADGPFVTMNDDAVLSRFVSCYKVGDSSQGEAQTIRGVKTFTDAILPYSSSVDIGSQSKHFRSVWSENGTFDIVGVSDSIRPLSAQSSIGIDSNDSFYQAYITEIYCDGLLQANKLKVTELIDYNFGNDFNIPVGGMVFGELIIEAKLKLEMCEASQQSPDPFRLSSVFPKRYGLNGLDGDTSDFFSQNFFLKLSSSILRHRENVKLDRFDDSIVENECKKKFIAHFGKDQYLDNNLYTDNNNQTSDGIPLYPSNSSEYSLYMIKEHYFLVDADDYGTVGDFEVSVDDSPNLNPIDFYNGVSSSIAKVIIENYVHTPGTVAPLVDVKQRFWCILVRTK